MGVLARIHCASLFRLFSFNSAPCPKDPVQNCKFRAAPCRYQSVRVLLGKVRSQIKWADVEGVKAELERQLDAILGGMTDEDRNPPEKKKKKKPAAQPPPQVCLSFV